MPKFDSYLIDSAVTGAEIFLIKDTDGSQKNLSLDQISTYVNVSGNNLGAINQDITSITREINLTNSSSGLSFLNEGSLVFAYGGSGDLGIRINGIGALGSVGTAIVLTSSLTFPELDTGVTAANLRTGQVFTDGGELYFSNGTSWVSLLSGGGGTATGTAFTPAGNIAASNVQLALEELDTEKGGLAGTNSWAGANSFTTKTSFQFTTQFAARTTNAGEAGWSSLWLDNSYRWAFENGDNTGIYGRLSFSALTASKSLIFTDTDITWDGNSLIGGDVTASAVYAIDNVILRSDGTGKGTQASGISIDDLNDMTGVGSISLSGTVDGRDVAADGSVIDKAVVSDVTGITGADAVTNIVSLTQAEYDAIGSPDASTFYLITDAVEYEYIQVACSDLTTDLVAGTTKAYFRLPYAATLSEVSASVLTAPTGSAITVDVNENGTSVLSTKLTIDATEKTSITAATPAVISDSVLALDSEITFDIDVIGSTIAGAGLIVTLKVIKS